jgi:hypothetical protein
MIEMFFGNHQDDLFVCSQKISGGEFFNSFYGFLRAVSSAWLYKLAHEEISGRRGFPSACSTFSGCWEQLFPTSRLCS